MFCSLALAGCATPSPGAPWEVDRHWLVGSWVLAENPCDTDGGVTYEADGRWTAYGEGGTWRFDGSKLRTTITERWEIEGGDAEPVSPPETHTAQISSFGQNHYVIRWQDGVPYTYVRC